MKTTLAALMALPLLATATLAETSDNPTFAPIAVKPATSGEIVNRVKRKTTAFHSVSLAEASVKDVDADGNGKISFEELLRHDLKTDF